MKLSAAADVYDDASDLTNMHCIRAGKNHVGHYKDVQ